MHTDLSRRSFLRRGLMGVSLAATAPHFLGLTSRAFAGDDATDDRILVVLQLSGGNDGLSTVVPFGDDAYYRARRTTAHAQDAVLRLTDHVGLHPGLAALHGAYGDGRMAIVQGVSYPNPNRSHFKSMDVWHTGDLAGRRVSTGWLGRAVDACCPTDGNPNLVVNIGKNLPYAVEAEKHKPVSFESPEAFRWTGDPKDQEEFEDLNGPVTAEEQVRWLHRVAVDARTSSGEIRAAASGYRPKAEYPRGNLGADLRTVAALIRGGIKTRVYYVSYGGFDTHNGQKNRHDNLMRGLDAALGAFLEDLREQGLSEKVLVMSFSEFGRRVQENGSLGTDHGVAGPMFLFGDAVRGGLYGAHPSLTDLDNGDLKMGNDFRSVYASVLDRWMGFDARKVLGGAFPTLPVL